MLNKKGLLVFTILALLVLSVVPAFAQDKTVIKFWHIFSDENRKTWTENVATAFETQFPQYDMDITTYADYESLLAAAQLAIEQNQAPALLQYFEVATQNARDTGYFKPIADALGDRTEVNGLKVNFDDFIQPVVNYYTVDGKFTSMPWNSSTPILYTNTAMLSGAGVDTPPATWADVEAACTKIMAAADHPEYCITWPNHGWFFEQWMAQQDAPYANNDNGRSARATEVLVNSEAGVAIASWWQNMYNNKYYYYSGVQRDWDATEHAIETGQTAMIITSSADARNITEAAAGNSIDLVTSRMPYNQEKEWTGNLIGGASVWLLNNLSPEVEDGALTWLLFLTSTENAASWHQATGYLPIRQSAVDLLEGQNWFKDNPNFFTASDQINNSKVTVATSGALLGTFPETRDIVTQAIEDLMLKGGDPAERMNQAKADADKLLTDYNSLYSG
jgi:sn-glycerol 3-phosphate transport system substrate-binding protein